MTKRSYPKVLAEMIVTGERFLCRGRDAETLLQLVEKGARGVTAFDFPGGPAFRLAAYVHDLRKLGLTIDTEREEHETGWHGVFVLRTAVHILAVGSGKEEPDNAA